MVVYSEINRAMNGSQNDDIYGIDYKQDMSKFESDGGWTRCRHVVITIKSIWRSHGNIFGKDRRVYVNKFSQIYTGGQVLTWFQAANADRRGCVNVKT